MTERSNSDIIVSNLNRLKEREATIKELRALEIAELPCVIDSTAGLRDIIRLYRQHMPLRNDDFTIPDRLEFCNRIVDLSKINLKNILIKNEGHHIINAVAYVKNQYSLEALVRLCNRITVTGEHIFSSFGELCDDIASGNADACIIPIENTSDGKLANFYSIIDRFELKIHSTCEIENSDGNQVTRYALLQRHIVIPESDSCFIEVSFVSARTNTIKDIIDVSALLNLSIYRINSMPLRYDKSSFEISSVLYGDIDSIMKFILFIKLNIPQHTILGLYNNVI